MLTSLEIQNYRNFKHLTIEKLGRVNLIIGKNNTGKSSLLEAVGILVSEKKEAFIFDILSNRHEFFETKELTSYDKLNGLSNLFIGRDASFTKDGAIKIKANNNEKSLFLRMSKYAEVISTTQVTSAFGEPLFDTGTSTIIHKEIAVDSKEIGGKLRIEFLLDGIPNFIPLSKDNTFDLYMEDESENVDGKVQFVSLNNYTNNELIFQLWQKTQLTELEGEVVKALQIFDSQIEKIERVGFATQHKKHFVICKLKGILKPVPLRSMGDGINSVFTIILAMVNCQDGYFLVDEFDTGLHYSVQKQLWEIVFYLADKLNIQVFVTTHSYDCIDAFADVLRNSEQPETDGLMIRLNNYEGNIEATIYEAEDIFNTTNSQIDPR